ncbi:MAG: flagellar hook-basal body complex protein FliE [Methanomassiliicoccales archaeon]|nr:flagellar hook-basal body complex protein FliE [Methanomassiliicoccales archaeon]
MRVYVLAGMPGAGKEEFVKVAMEEGFEVIRMGDVVRNEASKRGVANHDQGIGGFAHSERQIHGNNVWARRASALVKNNLTIIDGCRGFSELEVFKRDFGDKVVVIAIHASPRTRYNRLKTRDRDDAPSNWEEFVERDRRELGWGLGKVIVMADYMLVNEGALETFREDARTILAKI